MSPKYEIIIAGKPTPWARFGICRGRVFDRQSRERTSLQWKLKQAYQERPLSGPIALDCTFVFEPVKSLSKVKRMALLGKPHTQKPDSDNLVKFISDCASEIFWGDDAQVARLTARKIWGEIAQTVVHFEEINDEKTA